jgi:hypothetical protein
MPATIHKNCPECIAFMKIADKTDENATPDFFHKLFDWATKHLGFASYSDYIKQKMREDAEVDAHVKAMETGACIEEDSDDDTIITTNFCPKCDDILLYDGEYCPTCKKDYKEDELE